MKKTILILFCTLALSVLTAFAQAQNEDRVKIDPDQNYLILSTTRIKTMEKELDEAAAKGFRVLYGAPTASFDMALFLEKTETSENPYSYQILATTRNKTMEKEINEQAVKGFRILPRTIIYKQGLLTAEMVSVMEKAPNSTKIYEYKLVEARKETKLQTKIDEARAEGFNPITMITLGVNVVIMEKESESK